MSDGRKRGKNELTEEDENNLEDVTILRMGGNVRMTFKGPVTKQAIIQQRLNRKPVTLKKDVVGKNGKTIYSKGTKLMPTTGESSSRTIKGQTYYKKNFWTVDDGGGGQERFYSKANAIKFMSLNAKYNKQMTLSHMKASVDKAGNLNYKLTAKNPPGEQTEWQKFVSANKNSPQLNGLAPEQKQSKLGEMYRAKYNKTKKKVTPKQKFKLSTPLF